MNEPTRILIVEDRAADVDLARRAIHKVLQDCEFRVVEARKDFLQALEVFQPDLILSDYSLPHFNGMEALELALEHTPLTPLIIWTGSISEDVAVACMKAGANNYVLKENLKRLGPAVVHALEEKQSLVARHQAESSLRERERQLTMLFSNLPGPVYRCRNDADYTIEFISDGIVALSGYPAEDFHQQRQRFGKIIHPDDRERVWREVQTAVSQNRAFEMTYRIITASGNEKWVWEKGQGIFDAQGQLQALEGFMTDITERKQMEDALQEERNLLRTLIDHLPDRIYVMDKEGRKTISNTADWQASGGKSMDDVIGKTDFDMYPPALAQEFWALDRAVLDSGAPIINHEELGLDADGNLVSILTTKVPLRDSEGHVIGLVGIGRDITERKRAEEALRESENRLILALSGAQMSVWEWNLQTNQILWSPEIFDITGVKENDLGGTFESFTHLIHAGDIVRVMAAAQKAMTERTLFAEEFRIIRPDGEIRWLSNLGHAEYDVTRAHLRLIGTVQDVTQRKQAEIERQALLEIMQGLAKTKDLQEFLKLIHQSIAKAIHAQNFFVTLYQPNNGTFQEIYFVDQYDLPEPAPSKLEHSLTAYLFHSGQPLLLTQAQYDELAARNGIKLIGTPFASWLGVPLKTSGGTIGVMAVQDYENPKRYTERDKAFLESIASQVALAIEQKEASEALRESEEHYRAIFEGVQDAIFVESLDDRILMVNQRACEMFGYSPAEFTTKVVADIVPQGALILTAKEIDSIQVAAPRETLNRRANGEIFPTEISGRLQVINGEQVLLVVVRDITKRKRAETALMESSSRFRTLFEASPDAIMLIDPADNMSIVDCNTAACQMNGYNREELIGQCIDLLNTTAGNSAGRSEYLERIRQQGILRYETTHRRKDGTFIAVDVSTSLIRFGSRDIILGIDRDITQRKQAEMEARRQMAELEALYENGLAVGRLLEPRAIGNQVIETFANYFSWHHVAIRLRRAQSEDLELVAFNLPDLKETERANVEQHFAARIRKVGQGLSGQVFVTGTSLRTGNVHAHPQYIVTHAGIQSGLYMPLKIGERVIGVISVESETPDAFAEQDERLLATLANQAAIAFENARLYEAVRRELEERERAEEALRASETHYRELADSITDILFEMDQDLRYTYWNKASEIFSGIPAQGAIGKSMQELFGDSEEQSKREAVYKSVLQEQQARTFETEIVARGQKRALEINAYPSTRGVSVVAKDVTERKRAEIIMQKRFELMEYSAGHRLHELMQRAVDEVIELTGSTIGFFHFVEEDQKTMTMQAWSTNALRLCFTPVAEGAHLSLDQAGVWAEAIHERRSLIHNDYPSIQRKKGLPEGHLPLLREIIIPILRNERIMAVMAIANKLQDYTQYDLGIAERLADYAWDIIERKQMEVALETERNQLAQRVEERTADLSRANLNLARALRVKDEFLANMSHELRTPLNAILGLSESLAEQIAGPLNEKQQKYITTIGESGHHLLSLINDILDLAKIEAGQITLDINKVDIHSVCQSSLRMVKQLAQKKNQEVSLEIDHGLGLMWADERRLKQMIVNLLGNAVKFTPENGRLGLEVHGDEANNKVTITVWDNGIGIRKEDLARLFQPFVQLDSGLAREAPGTGLGLALVAQMARLHGGSVSVESEPNQGSRFSISLPWEPTLARETATRLRNTGKLHLIQPNPGKRPTILLVEDTEDVTMMIRDYLGRAGYKIVTAQDGMEGIVQAKLERPDLILMDIQMPRMDGIEATRKLRAEPDFRYTPIIALTALAMPSDRERCLAAGMDEYISKPINLKALARIIEGCLFDHEESQPR